MSQYSSYNDKDLFRLMQLNDENAFTEIYYRYWKPLFSVAANKVGDLSIAEEIVQDILVDLWNRRASIVLTGQLKTYLASAAKYKIIDARLKRDRLRMLEQKAWELQPKTDFSTDEIVHFEELREKLAGFVVNLPIKCRLVYQLKEESALSNKEIAEHLNISEKTVEYHLARAYRSLKEALHQVFTHLFTFF